MPYKIRSIKKKVDVKDAAIALDRFRTISEILEDNYKTIIPVIGGILLIGSVIGIYSFINNSSNKKALVLESEALKYYSGGTNKSDGNNKEEGQGKDYKKAADLFQKIIGEYPRSHSAKTALFYIGNAYFEQKDYDKSIEIYNKFSKEYPQNELMLSLVYQKMAYAYLAKGNNTDALNSFNKVISLKSAMNKDQAYFEIGRLSEVIGKNDDAIKVYENIIKDSPKSPLKAEADTRLNLLRKTPEIEKKEVEEK